MADTHLQVNTDGTTEMRSTVLWPSSKQEQKELIVGLFAQASWKVLEINHVTGCEWHLKCASATNELKIKLFISSIRDESRQPDEFKMQLGTTYPKGDTKDGWIELVLGIYVIQDTKGRDYILAGYDTSAYNFSTNPSIRGTRTSGLQKAYLYGMYVTEKSVVFRPDFLYYYIDSIAKRGNKALGELHNHETCTGDITSYGKVFSDYLTAIRTKPFLLLAGISGTGKSRIVKELAYSCCPVGELRSDPTSPGNYCLVEVKPNWNDSTELLGYETMLEGGGYHLTKFVKFVIKAMQHKDVPFFVCLDEMNLAPVEQYFAEFLSVLESRKDVEVNRERTIQSEPLIEASIFEKYENKLFTELFVSKEEGKKTSGYIVDEESPVYNSTYAKLKKDGLRIPRNLIVVGTVNMDDTTYQFSRKVIDRAMTIEMNEVNLDNMFDMDKADALSYTDDVVDKSWFFAPFAQSNKALPVIDEAERTQLVNKIKATIGQSDANGNATVDSLEAILGKTPFRIAYRVVNELILHFYALRWQNKEAEFEALYNEALDNILMMKVLPRIEGNEDLVKKPLTELLTWTQGAYPKSNKKVKEMLDRLGSHFTSFWP